MSHGKICDVKKKKSMSSLLGVQHRIRRSYAFKVDQISEHILDFFFKFLVREISLQETT